jgi:hypothetical protein
VKGALPKGDCGGPKGKFRKLLNLLKYLALAEDTVKYFKTLNIQLDRKTLNNRLKDCPSPSSRAGRGEWAEIL